MIGTMLKSIAYTAIRKNTSIVVRESFTDRHAHSFFLYDYTRLREGISSFYACSTYTRHSYDALCVSFLDNISHKRIYEKKSIQAYQFSYACRKMWFLMRSVYKSSAIGDHVLLKNTHNICIIENSRTILEMFLYCPSF
jgi:hypothetical protein